jgi:hypothetical protein
MIFIDLKLTDAESVPGFVTVVGPGQWVLHENGKLDWAAPPSPFSIPVPKVGPDGMTSAQRQGVADGIAAIIDAGGWPDDTTEH